MVNEVAKHLESQHQPSIYQKSRITRNQLQGGHSHAQLRCTLALDWNASVTYPKFFKRDEFLVIVQLILRKVCHYKLFTTSNKLMINCLDMYHWHSIQSHINTRHTANCRGYGLPPYMVHPSSRNFMSVPKSCLAYGLIFRQRLSLKFTR